MARKKKSSPEAEGSWLDTYADLVTLLLCFFVLLFSQSSIEEEKWEKLLKAFQNPTDEPQQIVIDQNQDGEHLGGSPGDTEEIDFSELAQMIQQIAEAMGESDNVAIEAGNNMLFIRFKNELLFGPNSSVLKDEAQEFLTKAGNIFKEYENDISVIRVNGHTAAVTTSSGQYVSDRLLSSDRANAVVMYLEDVIKLEPEKLVAIGYGKNYPIATNDDEAGRAENRRVELMILGKTGGSSDDYWSNIFSGNMSTDAYDQAYEALDRLPSLDIVEAGKGQDYIGGFNGSADDIDKIDLDNVGQ